MKITEIIVESSTNSFVQKFAPWVAKQLGIKLPKIVLLDQPRDTTFGQYVPDEQTIYLVVGGRHPVDVLRTLAHELTHHRQELKDNLPPGAGATGTDQENEANAEAGVMMRDFAKQNPEYFGLNINEDVEQLPHLFLDMDGVQADFFDSWAKWEQVNHYKDIPNSDESITRMSQQGPEFVEKFFSNLPQLSGGQAIVNWCTQHNIPFTVLSAPLRDNHEASIRGKRTWLDHYVPGSSDSAIFTSSKFKYAKTNGQPNVLVDDFGSYINAWREAGGIGIKHTDANTNETIRALEKIYLKKIDENFANGQVKGKSRPGRVKRAGASCAGSVTDLRSKAKNASGERARMYHWCANMKSGKKK